jgi:5-methylthioadenosine/S-adenosylhomocysteine deaminase
MLSAGLVVGLGSDSMASNNRMDLLEEARIALLMQRTRALSNETPTAADALALVTIGGANAIGLGDVVGTLEVGKEADLAAFALDAVGPTHDPVVAAVFSSTAARARFVSVAGTVLVRDGMLAAPRAGLAERMQDLGDKLAEWLASGGEMRGVV